MPQKVKAELIKRKPIWRKLLRQIGHSRTLNSSVMTLELNQRTQQLLDKIYSEYGNDSQKWEYYVDVLFKCRVAKLDGFKSVDILATLLSGDKKCPFEGKLEQCVKVPHPESNIAGAIAARDFNEICPVCGRKPQESDFEIRSY